MPASDFVSLERSDELNGLTDLFGFAALMLLLPFVIAYIFDVIPLKKPLKIWYYVTFEDPDGYNLSAFVTAKSVDEAMEMMNRRLIFAGLPIIEDSKELKLLNTENEMVAIVYNMEDGEEKK